MRDYAKVSPKFWTGNTGQELARRGSEALVVALYLMTSPHSNMLGLYYQPVLYLAEETGLTPEGASKGLQACIEEGFCMYDQQSKMVWVIEMASYQIGSELAASDKRCKGIQKDYNALPNCQFLGDFFDRYAQAFHLTDRREFVEKTKGLVLRHTSPLQAPSKPGTGTGEGTGEGNPPTPQGGCQRFEDFWAAWPKSERKQDKVKCARKWKSSSLDAIADQILADIETKKLTQKWQEAGGKYIEAPLVYLNGRRWEDGVEPAGQDAGRSEVFV